MDVRIQVKFQKEEMGFSVGKAYDVMLVQGGKFLLVDDDAHFVWMAPERTTPWQIQREGERLFDYTIHSERRRLERLSGKLVELTTWENLGFDPDEVNEEQMLVYRATVESYDGQTLFLTRDGGEGSRFGVLPKAIATIVEKR